MDRFLASKLSIPLLPSHPIARRRLLLRLEADPARGVTLVSAPPGFGKTTLLCQWQLQVLKGDRTMAWVSLDGDDNDPLLFLGYLAQALDRARPGTGQQAIAMLQAAPAPQPRAVLATLLNNLAGAGSLVLVLDDYHLITEPEVHRVVQYLVDHLPPTLQLVIATREDPPLALARLGSQGRLTELRTPDLRCTSAEITAFFRDGGALRLSAAECASVERSTEGWMAALRLSLLWHRQNPDRSLSDGLTGMNRHIYDYLAEEVLRRQPAPIQLFLMQTAILDRLHGPLCSALTELAGGAALLEQLEQANVFLVPLDEERSFYRYHHLFADFLRRRLAREMPGLVPELHRRAARWCEEHGWASAAVDHALAAGDVLNAARMVEQVGYAVLATTQEIPHFLHQVDKLPDSVLQTQPGLCVLQSHALFIQMRLEPAELCLRRAEAGLPQVQDPEKRQWLEARVALIRAKLARARGATSSSITYSLAALDRTPAPDANLRGPIMTDLGIHYWLDGQPDAALETLREAWRQMDAAGAFQSSLIALMRLAQIQAALGQLRLARETYQRVLNFPADEAGLPNRYPQAVSLMGVAEIHREAGDLDGALQMLTTSLTLSGTNNPGRLAAAYATLARVRWARGDAEGAMADAGQAEQLSAPAGPLPVFPPIRAVPARIWLALGDLRRVERYLADAGVSPTDRVTVSREPFLMLLVRYYLATGQPSDSLSLLDRLLEPARDQGRRGSVVEMLTLQSAGLFAANRETEALARLDAATALGAPEGYFRLFIEDGAPLLHLVPHMSSVMAAASAAAEPGRPAALLSRREIEVLKLIARGESNEGIAEALTVNLSTVKTHINNLYRKLNVASRTQALARARELGLLA